MATLVSMMVGSAVNGEWRRARFALRRLGYYPAALALHLGPLLAYALVHADNHVVESILQEVWKLVRPEWGIILAS